VVPTANFRTNVLLQTHRASGGPWIFFLGYWKYDK
jgi:hypothetical protein